MRTSTTARSGWLRVDRVDAALAVADGRDHLLARVDQQAGEPGPQQHGVLGDHDPHGISTSSVVGPPGGLITCIVPPTAATRSRRPRSPVPRRLVGTTAAVVADLDDQPVADAHDRDPRAASPARGGRRW